ncbi:unnamed protein product [Trichogramma brassicae]|uniref:ATP-dependent DNA helicase n=1 Tax=Trichogramma brassicae TaxID=86971 RepID=A0A6H5IU31_9HYME|nr:unnamed protein product [Trichogramma brassicae]
MVSSTIKERSDLKLGQRLIDVAYDWNVHNDLYPSLKDIDTFLKTFKSENATRSIKNCNNLRHIALSPEQLKVVQICRTQIQHIQSNIGDKSNQMIKRVIIQGKAGSGKSTLINAIVQEVTDALGCDAIAVVAPTGAAALNLQLLFEVSDTAMTKCEITKSIYSAKLNARTRMIRVMLRLRYEDTTTSVLSEPVVALYDRSPTFRYFFRGFPAISNHFNGLALQEMSGAAYTRDSIASYDKKLDIPDLKKKHFQTMMEKMWIPKKYHDFYEVTEKLLLRKYTFCAIAVFVVLTSERKTISSSFRILWIVRPKKFLEETVMKINRGFPYIHEDLLQKAARVDRESTRISAQIHEDLSTWTLYLIHVRSSWNQCPILEESLYDPRGISVDRFTWICTQFFFSTGYAWAQIRCAAPRRTDHHHHHDHREKNCGWYFMRVYIYERMMLVRAHDRRRAARHCIITSIKLIDRASLRIKRSSIIIV